jgi:trehalose 6-phosphate synthase/phosphatase
MESLMGTRDRLVVVSNRLPLTLKRSKEGWRTERSTGGLATAMEPIRRQTNGLWIGWSGDSSGVYDQRREKLLRRWAERERYFAVDLVPEVAEGFYEGYANQTLWPVFHHFPSLLHFNPDHWKAYIEANRRFCEIVAEHIRPNDLVWIHDYQLMLLPRFLREAVPEARIGFFLHIPFPSSAVFRVLPRRDELLNGLLGADYVAFHTYGYLQHFRRAILRILGMEMRMDQVDVSNRTVKLAALPIGIATNEFTDLIERDETTKKRLTEIKDQFSGRKLLLAVDRLDYTKGIPERLRTFRRLLEQSPGLQGNVVLVQVAVPSRGVIPRYTELRHEVDELVGKINGKLSTPGWTPIIYIRRGISRTELAALYAAADLAWVTPLRDGLNLVAKEYAACQKNGEGVLVLSEFAGAAAEMGEAFIVNPYDEERTAAVIERALTLSAEERRDRMAALHARVARNDVFSWSDRFLQGLADAALERVQRTQEGPRDVPVDKLEAAFRSARKRSLLLDYDGTLVTYANRPRDAVPPAELLDILSRLAADQANTVAIVSGRSRFDLDKWFGRIPRLWIAAEHGAIIRSPQTKWWETYHPGYSDEWKQRILPVLEHFVDLTPGSFIEEKEFSLVWHYRMSDPEFGKWLANELVANLEQMLAETELRATRGCKCVEVKMSWANKGEVLSRLEQVSPHPSFLLGAGDDRTDEDLFARMPEDSWTIHVGPGETRAQYSVQDPAQMCEMLKSLANSERVQAVAVGE